MESFISPAVGGPNFLHPAEGERRAFFTKSQTKAKFLRKANAFNRAQANARFLDPAEGDSRYLPSNGVTRLQVSPNDWVSANPGGTSSVSSSSTSSGTDLRTGAAEIPIRSSGGAHAPSVPAGSADPGSPSFELCYEANAPFVVIDRVSLDGHLGRLRPSPIAPGTFPIEDLTDRGDEACRTYSGAAPAGARDPDGHSPRSWSGSTSSTSAPPRSPA